MILINTIIRFGFVKGKSCQNHGFANSICIGRHPVLLDTITPALGFDARTDPALACADRCLKWEDSHFSNRVPGPRNLATRLPRVENNPWRQFLPSKLCVRAKACGLHRSERADIIAKALARAWLSSSRVACSSIGSSIFSENESDGSSAMATTCAAWYCGWNCGVACMTGAGASGAVDGTGALATGGTACTATRGASSKSECRRAGGSAAANGAGGIWSWSSEMTIGGGGDASV